MLDAWLGAVPMSEFLERHYLKRPLSLPDAAITDVCRCSWQTMGDILGCPRPLDLLVVRDGELVDARQPRGLDDLRGLMADGCSVVVRGAEQHDAGLHELATGFHAKLTGRVAIQLYATPAGRYSFDWHYDAEEVFILQTRGVKEYFLRANTVNPRPRPDALPHDMQYERETSRDYLACTLLPGDWLYIPAGYWHRARAREDALSISIGVLPVTAADLPDDTRRADDTPRKAYPASSPEPTSWSTPA